jgi:hypothetical protein
MARTPHNFLVDRVTSPYFLEYEYSLFSFTAYLKSIGNIM